LNVHADAVAEILPACATPVVAAMANAILKHRTKPIVLHIPRSTVLPLTQKPAHVDHMWERDL
jgi:hypothetical protein